MRRAHKWSIIAGSSLVSILVLLIVVVSWISGQGLLHPDRDRTSFTPTGAGLSWEWANFTTEDGVPIVGWWMPTDASPHDNATVIFLHGYGDAKNQSLQTAPFLVRTGRNVLAFDFRACGESGGDFTTAGILEVREVKAAIAWVLARPGFPSDPTIILLGWSMGGSTAIRAATTLPQVDAVIADGAYSRLQNIVDTSIVHFIKDAIGFRVPRWPIGPLSVQFASWAVGVELDEDPPSAAIARLDLPILLIQGSEDTTVLPSNVDELAEAAGPGIEVHRVAEARHVRSFQTDPGLYELVVDSFLDRVDAGLA